MFTSPDIIADYKYCERIIKKHSRSFYYAFSQLPKEKARAVYAIYAFCRTADDRVDENYSPEAQLAALDSLETDLMLFDKGSERDEPLWRALRDVFNRYDMDIQPFYDQLKGQRMDIGFEIPNTLEHVETYGYYVAGTVGLMLLPIIATEHGAALKEHAIGLGIAMQITNILRDVGEDYRENKRIYLPIAEMERVLYSIDDLHRSVINEGFINLWELMAKRAEFLYECFYETVNQYDADSRLPVITSARIYRGILDEVRNNGYDCFSKKQAVSLRRMMNILDSLKVEKSC